MKRTRPVAKGGEKPKNAKVVQTGRCEVSNSTGTQASKSAGTFGERAPGGISLHFYWQFVNEWETRQGFRVAEAGQTWQAIKNDFEDTHLRRAARQQKRGLVSSSFMAFRLDEWEHVKRDRAAVFNSDTPRHVQAHEVIQVREQIVIARFPSSMVAKALNAGYSTVPPDIPQTHDTSMLHFEEGESEEQRLNRLLNFNTTTRQDIFGSGGGDRGGGPRAAGKMRYRRGEKPPPGYRCHNCNGNDHFRQDCDKKRKLAPKGIPKNFLEKVEPSMVDSEDVFTLDDGTLVKAKIVNAKVIR